MTMPSNISVRLTGADSFELVGRRVADILAVQLAQQRFLATEDEADPAPYDVRVFIEATAPFGEWAGGDYADTRPVINVSFNSSAPIKGRSSIVRTHAFSTIYTIDCYAVGRALLDEDDPEDADTRAGLEAQRVAGLARRILMAGENTYLGLRGVVANRSVSSVEAFIPAIGDVAVERVRCVRLSIVVEHTDEMTQANGEPLEEILVTGVSATTGLVLYEVEVNHS